MLTKYLYKKYVGNFSLCCPCVRHMSVNMCEEKIHQNITNNNKQKDHLSHELNQVLRKIPPPQKKKMG